MRFYLMHYPHDKFNFSCTLETTSAYDMAQYIFENLPVEPNCYNDEYDLALKIQSDRHLTIRLDPTKTKDRYSVINRQIS